ncbi:MAG: prepilin-type N-terminal cleavage/methylation domain-containing protein [Candidatus Hydrogenedentes bacterium]|nr:prepilin-type N-terminal cleavage/methylation domain-containing protein [Candidatus Hydrogenedentota bacterium]
MQLRKKEGFSPVEVLIAMAILAIGIIAVVRLFPSGLAFSRIAQERSIAAELAQNNLSRMRMAGASNLLGVAQAGALYGFNSAASSYGLGIGGRNDVGNIVGGYASSVRRVNGAGEQALVRVTFTVDMPDGRRENFVTYLTDY